MLWSWINLVLYDAYKLSIIFPTTWLWQNFTSLLKYQFKEALDNFSFIPQFFFKKVDPPIFFQKSWDLYTIRCVYLYSDCMILLANLNLIKKIHEFSLQRPFSKSLLLKMAAMVMIIEFGTIHHYSSLEEISEACLCSSLNRYKN